MPFSRRIREDVTELKAHRAEIDRRLSDHDTVLRDIRKHLGDLVTEFGKFRTTVLVGLALMAAGSPSAQHLLKVLVS